MKKHVIVLVLFSLFTLASWAADPFLPTAEGYVGFVAHDTTSSDMGNMIHIEGEIEFLLWETFFISGGASSVMSIGNGSTIRRGTLISEYSDAFFSGGFSFKDVCFGYKEIHTSESMINSGGVRREVFFSFQTTFGK